MAVLFLGFGFWLMDITSLCRQLSSRNDDNYRICFRFRGKVYSHRL